MISVEGSVRVDLLGGTLDIAPINLILKKALTLNLATSLKAKVDIFPLEREEEGVEIHSKDYHSTQFFHSRDLNLENIENNFFGPLTFLVRILLHKGVKKGISIHLSSGSPPGAGLGGSSAMGVTFYKALSVHLGETISEEDVVKIVGNIEAKSLDCGPTGYQDYYPALYGGVLALIPEMDGVKVEQLFSKELAEALEDRLSLISSEESRFSGLNNWEVIKRFFDKDPKIRKGLEEIAQLSFSAYESLRLKKFDNLFELISKEGEVRERLFPDIVTPSMRSLFESLKKHWPDLGMKICGAGGGGCFLLIHKPEDKVSIQEKIESETKMKVLPLKVLGPIH